MTTEDSPKHAIPSGFEVLGTDARVEFRMNKSNKAYTSEDAAALLAELDAYQVSHPRGDGKKLADSAAAEQIGISPSTLSDLKRGQYKADPQRPLSKVDEFLAKERSKEGRFDGRAFAMISIAQKMMGVVNSAMRNNSMAAIIADSGDGKTCFARAFAADREGAVLVRIDEAHADQRGLSVTLCREFKLGTVVPHRERTDLLVGYLQKNRNTILLVDEAQKLRADGLEYLRDLHDLSDPEGRRNLPIVLFGDATFYRLIVKARNGEPGPIKPQMTRRLYPVLHVEGDAFQDGDGTLFNVADIAKILRNQRLKVVTDDGVRWLASLANTRGWGSLGFAMVVARMAFDIASKSPVTVADLQAALPMVVGPRSVALIDESAGGTLMRAVG